MSDREIRMFACELRAAGNDEATKIEGYGSIFNIRSDNLGGFREVVAPGAFDDVLGDDVRALWNHDPNIILGRTASGTLALSVDEKGLSYVIDAPQTQLVRDMVIAPMKRGDVNQSSFAFRVARGGEEWDEDDDGVIVRTITRFARLFDVSPVTIPAYPDASSAVRSLQAWREARDSGALKKSIAQRGYRQRIIDLIRP